MKFTFDDHPRLVRALTIVSVVLILYMSGLNFYNIASVPTDENVFMDPPSTAFVAVDVPASFVKETGLKMFDKGDEQFPQALVAGDAFISVNKTVVKTLAEARHVIGAAAGDSVEIFLLRASLNKHFIYTAAKKDLTPNVLVEHRDVVVVTSVLPGGASDRAGMKPGDIISRINDSSFTSAMTADKMLRQGQVDKSLRYDIDRQGRTLSLQVTLAKFGVPFVLLVFVFVGLCFMGTGMFLALKRPHFIAARLLGWGFIALSCILMNVSAGRESDEQVYRIMRSALVLWGVFGGAALFTHSFFYFPIEKTRMLANKWHVIVIYAVSCILCLALIVTKNQLFLVAEYSVMLYFGVVRFLNREASEKRVRPSLRGSGVLPWAWGLLKAAGGAIWPGPMMRAVKGSTIAVALVTLAGVLLQQKVSMDANQVAIIIVLSFLLFPLAYLYTIGHYQLLDMSLRIRRNLQYSALTIAWNTILVFVLLVVFFSLPNIALPLQNIEFTGASILITDAPVSALDFSRNEKIGAMLLGLASVFGYVIVRRTGQKLIDEKYYQTQFDYRRALSELSEALAAKLGMEDLAHGLVTTLTGLLKVKHASVLFFRNETSCCCLESAGDERSSLGTFCTDDLAMLTAALKGIKDSARVEYLPLALRSMLERMGIRIVLPIRSKEQLIGALLVGEKLSETAFKDEDISFLNSAAMQASISIENAFLYEELAEQERMKHELEIARKIQLASLPQEIPQVRGLDIAGSSLPAMEVGGDFYDYLETDAQKVTVVIGDVSGKGTSAALYMSKVQGILRSLFSFGLSPRDLFIRANRLLCRDLEKRSFVTVLGAEFDLGARTVRIARAGHLPLYYYDAATTSVEKIVPPGIGLGLNDAELPFSRLEEFVRPLHAGDVYLFVSDGITEAHNEEGEEFGDDRLCAFLNEHHAEPSSLVCDTLYADVKRFAGAAPQHDDQTIVCIGATDH